MVGQGLPHPAATLDFDLSDMPRILMSSAAATPANAALSDADYQRETASLLARIEATADRWLQDDVIDIDTRRTGGLLELTFPGGSKIIINTQPPLHEVWLAARGGGFHYRWVDGQWRDTRDGSEFIAALSAHASLQGGKALDFSR
jgi:CyaY protein